MKRLFLPAILIIARSVFCFGQHLEYTGIFAPSESLVKPSEKPYRMDLCLNGSWQFQPVQLPDSFKEGSGQAPDLPRMKADGWDNTPIRIPSPWNVNSFADQDGLGGDFRTFPGYPKEWEDVKMGWLRKKFLVPLDWKGRHIILHFDAVAGDAEVLINGKAAGRHFGVFFPFDLDVDKLIIPGTENEICVGVRKASLFDKKGNYGRRTYQAGSFWGQHIAGIWQDVYLEALADVYVSDVYVKPAVGRDRLEAEVSIRNNGNKSVSISIDADAFKWMKKGGSALSDIALPGSDLASSVSLHLPAVKVTIPAHGETKVTLSSEVKGKLDLWSPESPNLYGLVANVRTGGKIIDKKYTRFGWREVTIKGSDVLINGRPVVMKGDSWHFLGIPQMTRRYAVSWFSAMRDANQNTVRLHAQPYPSFYLDVADEMGILVLDETAIWASDGGPKLDDPGYWADTKDHIAELILRDRNHPSVFGWSVSNEVMPVVRNVFRDPPGMRDTLVKQYSIWRDVCRKLDPSRQWISADGEDDGEGTFPAYIIHYGGNETMDQARNSGKPWGVGEAGNAYYGTPQQVSETNGDRAYESFLGRMEGVAASSYESLINQRTRNAVYQSVFNMVWYGLRPLPLGLKDTTQAPTLNDGVYFTSFREGLPGVQPERLGPYCTTLNPGYDPSLPLYQTWPLFDAIRDANARQPAGIDKWTVKKEQAAVKKDIRSVKSVGLLSGAGSTLFGELKRTGVSLKQEGGANVPDILFIDGVHPPASGSLSLINKVYQKGGTVIVWGADQQSLPVLNLLLPAPLEISPVRASSLLPAAQDDIISGITNADLYFSELRPPEIITNGLAGRLAEQSKVLLKSNHTDWLKWNGQPEYAKTAMIVRSEREKTDPGIALITKDVGAGRLIVTTLPAAPKHTKAEKLVRAILRNAGVSLESGNDIGKPLLKDGRIVRALVCGSFPAGSLENGAPKSFIDQTPVDQFRAGVRIDGKPWTAVYSQNGMLDLSGARLKGPDNDAVAYLSFWVSSSRSLDDLLAEPDIPVVNLEISSSNAVQVYLNGKEIINDTVPGSLGQRKSKAEALKLHKGWNHFLIKLIRSEGKWMFSGKFTSDKVDFLSDLASELEKP